MNFPKIINPATKHVESSFPRRRGSSDFTTYATGLPPAWERRNLKFFNMFSRVNNSLPNMKHQHWRGSWGIFGLESAPVLVFASRIDGFHRQIVQASRSSQVRTRSQQLLIYVRYRTVTRPQLNMMERKSRTFLASRQTRSRQAAVPLQNQTMYLHKQQRQQRTPAHIASAIHATTEVGHARNNPRTRSRPSR